MSGTYDEYKEDTYDIYQVVNIDGFQSGQTASGAGSVNMTRFEILLAYLQRKWKVLAVLSALGSVSQQVFHYVPPFLCHRKFKSYSWTQEWHRLCDKVEHCVSTLTFMSLFIATEVNAGCGGDNSSGESNGDSSGDDLFNFKGRLIAKTLYL